MESRRCTKSGSIIGLANQISRDWIFDKDYNGGTWYKQFRCPKCNSRVRGYEDTASRKPYERQSIRALAEDHYEDGITERERLENERQRQAVKEFPPPF